MYIINNRANNMHTVLRWAISDILTKLLINLLHACKQVLCGIISSQRQADCHIGQMDGRTKQIVEGASRLTSSSRMNVRADKVICRECLAPNFIFLPHRLENNPPAVKLIDLQPGRRSYKLIFGLTGWCSKKIALFFKNSQNGLMPLAARQQPAKRKDCTLVQLCQL